jgi:hypothetical protein
MFADIVVQLVQEHSDLAEGLLSGAGCTEMVLLLL